MGIREIVAAVAVSTVGVTAAIPLLSPQAPPKAPPLDHLSLSTKIDDYLTKAWGENAAPSIPSELTALRRASLSLLGTIPSLEQIRAFQRDEAPQRLERWISALVEDPRHANYFAERLARAFVGTDNGAFLIFRRDRYVAWLRRSLAANLPYDELVREMIQAEGVWTSAPQTNFITAAFDVDQYENKLAARSVRAFLGQRMDCAQCHDHPFDDWTQADFEGLAAHFASARTNLGGVIDDPERRYEAGEDENKRSVSPRVPFGEKWLEEETSTDRERLAQWITHPSNLRFPRAAVNRVFALVVGKPLHSPVDALPDPPSEPATDLLTLLSDDFRENGYNLRRLVAGIASSRLMRLPSTDPAPLGEWEPEPEWTRFPLTRLRPEQVIGSMLQASSVSTLDAQSHWAARAIRFFRERDFVEEYGDLGEDELEPGSGTIPQALLRMNGKLSKELTKAQPFSTTGRVDWLARTEGEAVDTLYLSVLTRLPTAPERAHFTSQLNGLEGDARTEVLEDMVWSLINAPEFSWNH